MDVKQHEEQKINFAKTKAKLENMKPDPSISIDEFISKILVSNGSKDIPGSHSNPAKANSEVKNPCFASNVESLNNSADFWDNFQSSSTITQSNEVENPVNDDDFDEFTSFSPSFISTNLKPIPEISTDRSQPRIPNNAVSVAVNFTNGDVFEGSPTKASVVEQIEVQPPTITETTLDEDGFEEYFKHFQGCSFESAPSPIIPHKQPQKELPTDGWLRCLTESRSMLDESASALSPLASDSDTDAFLSTPRGCDFIYELIEIYGICQRIRLAASISNVSDPRLLKILSQIDQTWSDLAKFVKSNEHKQMLNLCLAESIKATSAVDALSVEPNCGVCVTPVSPSNRFGPGSATISLAGRVYHASCANLWVNRIEFSLPSLLAP
ncbi:unnamed protein product [Rodentolepis nana]|uniref:Synergin gamma n=1 Tax=Rodentolepis nana TaxID=102285 RepID=A0A0R3T109_RODNA|nr:unnamed protein product [Rodentolepis nana]